MNYLEKKNLEKKMSYHQKSRFFKIFQEDFFLLNIEKFPNNFKVDISGSSKNIYSITLFENTKKIKCNCPDMKSWASYNKCICKHSCFLLFKVLKLKDLGDFFNNLQFNNNIFDNIIIELFNLLNRLNNIDNTDINLFEGITNKELLEKYKKIINKKKEIKEEKKDKYASKKENKNDMCSICFNDFEEKEELLDCPKCKQTIHKLCMEKWLSLGKSTCVYCRSDVWKDYGIKKENDYENLDNE